MSDKGVGSLERTWECLADSIENFMIGESGDGDVAVLVTRLVDFAMFCSMLEERLCSFTSSHDGSLISWLKREDRENSVEFTAAEEWVLVTKDKEQFNNLPSWIMYKVQI